MKFKTLKANSTDAVFSIASDGTETLLTGTITQTVSIDLTKTINASKAIDTTGLTYEFDFKSEAASNDVAGEVDVPATSDIATVTLVASAMAGSTQTLPGVVTLPNANEKFSQAGMYKFTVEETPSDTNTDRWSNSKAKYRIRLFVSNEINNAGEYTGRLVYGGGGLPEYTIEQILDDAGNAIDSSADGIGDKVTSLTFTNQSIVRKNLVVEETAAGAYADLTYQFPVSVELTLPDWAIDETISIEKSADGVTIMTVGVTDSIVVNPTTHKATLDFTASHGKTVMFKNLSAGTKYKVTESSSRDGVNVYKPSATFVYGGTGVAETHYATNDNTVTVDEGVEEIEVNVTAGDINTRSMVGDADGNKVTILNTLTNPPSPTGIIMYNASWLISLITLTSAAAFVIHARNRRSSRSTFQL